jgi:hypothetical protein
MKQLGFLLGLVVISGALTAASFEQMNTTSRQTLAHKTLTDPVLNGTITACPLWPYQVGNAAMTRAAYPTNLKKGPDKVVGDPS